MDCPHCGIAFHDSWTGTDTMWIKPGEGTTSGWRSRGTFCPSCHEATIDVVFVDRFWRQPGGWDENPFKAIRVYPQNTFRKPTPVEVPPDIKEDYEEACKVLPISHKASAALSRRCLQAILRGQGYAQKDLAQQIDAVLKEPDTAKAIPTGLRETVDVIRNFGNFSAHHITDQTTLQVIAVEEGEAEWCLDILEEMFDHYYVKPAQAKARKDALDAKLKAAGKPPSK